MGDDLPGPGWVRVEAVADLTYGGRAINPAARLEIVRTAVPVDLGGAVLGESWSSCARWSAMQSSRTAWWSTVMPISPTCCGTRDAWQHCLTWNGRAWVRLILSSRRTAGTTPLFRPGSFQVLFLLLR
jgi:hypothetical protein